MKPNILFISLAFPPKNCPESLQTAKYFKYLKDLTGDIQVITAACPSLFMPLDKSLERYLSEETIITELYAPESKYLNSLIRKSFPVLLELPDHKILFTFQTGNITRKLQIEPHIIYSRSYPLSSAFIAYKLRRKLNIPWVLHLSDPWTISPIEKRTPVGARYNNQKEAEFFSMADYVCLTSKETIHMYTRKYPELEHKFVFMPNVYDPEDKTPTLKKSQSEKVIFTYTGGLANTRTNAHLLKALHNLYITEPDFLKNVVFNFAGSFDRKNTALFKEYNLPFVNNLGILPFDKAKQLTSDSDVLIVIDTFFQNPDDAMFLPSKILDYAVAGKPILAITSRNSTTWKFIQGRFGSCYEHNNINKIIAGIKTIINNTQTCNDYNTLAHSSFLEQYAADYNAQRLADLFNRLS